MKKYLSIIVILLLLILPSCNIITEPLPIIGNYLVRNRVGSDGYIYCFSIKDDGTFIFIQRGGASTSETFIFRGTWESSLSHFDFYSASGVITFTPDEPKEVNYESLVFTVERDNNFNFQWILDHGSVNATLALDAVDDALSKDIGTAQNISDDEFNEKLQEAEDKINGVEDDEEELPPEESEEPSPDNPDDTGDDPETEDPSVDEGIDDSGEEPDDGSVPSEGEEIPPQTDGAEEGGENV